jgi:hypothetical protein
MDDMDGLLVAARQLHQLGQLKQAADQLESVWSTQKDPKVLCELADIVTYQGYRGRALSFLELGMGLENDGAESHFVRARIQMQYCFLMPIVTCSFGPYLETAGELHREHLLHHDWRQYERDAVRPQGTTSWLHSIN